MSKRKLTAQQIRELESGDGRYYICQEMAFAPSIADGWPSVIPAPHSRSGRLVLRQVPEEDFDLAQMG